MTDLEDILFDQLLAAFENDAFFVLLDKYTGAASKLPQKLDINDPVAMAAFAATRKEMQEIMDELLSLDGPTPRTLQ